MKKITLTLAICMMSGQLWAGNGSTAAGFLELGPGARAMGMGGAFTAVADDANTIYWNAAGLGNLNQHEVTLSHLSYVEGITYEYGALAYKLGSLGLGFNITSLRSGSIERTTEDASGNFAGSQGSFNTQNMAVGASLGKAFGSHLSLGVGVKGLQDKVHSESRTGVALDSGLLVKTRPLNFGITLQNMGPSLGEDPLPSTLNFGVSSKPFDSVPVLFAADLGLPLYADVDFKLGAEYEVAKILTLRAGWRQGPDIGNGAHAGAGFKLGNVKLDYAYAPSTDFADVHRVSLSFAWGGGDRLEEVRLEPAVQAKKTISKVQYTKTKKVSKKPAKKAASQLKKTKKISAKSYEPR